MMVVFGLSHTNIQLCKMPQLIGSHTTTAVCVYTSCILRECSNKHVLYTCGAFCQVLFAIVYVKISIQSDHAVMMHTHFGCLR